MRIILIKSIKLLLDYGNGKEVEVEMSPDGKQFLSVRPLFQPMGLIFYLDKHPLLKS